MVKIFCRKNGLCLIDEKKEKKTLLISKNPRPYSKIIENLKEYLTEANKAYLTHDKRTGRFWFIMARTLWMDALNARERELNIEIGKKLTEIGDKIYGNPIIPKFKIELNEETDEYEVRKYTDKGYILLYNSVNYFDAKEYLDKISGGYMKAKKKNPLTVKEAKARYGHWRSNKIYYEMKAMKKLHTGKYPYDFKNTITAMKEILKRRGYKIPSIPLPAHLKRNPIYIEKHYNLIPFVQKNPSAPNIIHCVRCSSKHLGSAKVNLIEAMSTKEPDRQKKKLLSVMDELAEGEKHLIKQKPEMAVEIRNLRKEIEKMVFENKTNDSIMPKNIEEIRWKMLEGVN